MTPFFVKFNGERHYILGFWGNFFAGLGCVPILLGLAIVFPFFLVGILCFLLAYATRKR